MKIKEEKIYILKVLKYIFEYLNILKFEYKIYYFLQDWQFVIQFMKIIQFSFTIKTFYLFIYFNVNKLNEVYE